MVVCYTNRLVSISIVTREASSATWWKQCRKPHTNFMWSLGNPANDGRKDCRREWIEDIRETWLTNPLSSSYRGSQRPKQQSWSWHGSAWGILHTYCGWLAWGFYGIHNSGSSTFLTLLSVLGIIFLLLSCVCQPRYEDLCLVLLHLFMLCSQEAWSSLKGNKEVDLWERRGVEGPWMSAGRGSCGRDVLYERRINK